MKQKHNDIQISVVIPVFNGSSVIRRCLESVINQSFSPLEIIVVNDASEDGDQLEQVMEQIKEVSPISIRYVRNCERGNGAIARNIGIDMAIGNFIGFLDADDEWDPEKLKKIRPFLTQEKPQLLYSPVKIVKDGSIQEIKPVRGKHTSERVGDYLFLAAGQIQTSTIVCSSRFAKTVKFDQRFIRHQDYDFVLRAERFGVEFVYVDMPLVRYNTTEGYHSPRTEPAEYSAWWVWSMKDYLSRDAYVGFEMINITGRYIAHRRYLTALAFFITRLLTRRPFWIFKARGKLFYLVRKCFYSFPI